MRRERRQPTRRERAGITPRRPAANAEREVGVTLENRLSAGEHEGVGRCARNGERTRRSGMTDRRDEERERTRREQREQEGDERRRDHVERRFDDLKEAWRRHHPSEEEDTDRNRPQRGRGKRA